MIELVLGICTILGGIAALMYFWEKRQPGWLSRLRNLGRTPAIPIDPSSVFAYANGHPRPIRLVRAIAERRGLPVRDIDGESAWLNEQIQVLGIKTTRELDAYVKRHGYDAVRLADYLTPKQPIDTGFLLGLVLELVAIERGGKEGLRCFYSSLKYSTRGTQYADEIYHVFEQISAHK
jgi:hypothetical protein